ncbi:MAG: hypothetical protein ACJ8M1_13880 [Chthoniobacterales bacterium]
MKRPIPSRVPERLFRFRDQYVTAAGKPLSAVAEREADRRKNDHVWITVDVGADGQVQIALSTMSRQSRAAGFDPRIRVGITRANWTELPLVGIEATAGLDYAILEAEQSTHFVEYEREALEQLLIGKARRSIFVQAWGEFYVRSHMGVHQVHSRRASFAVPRDLIGQDGAVRFYFQQPNDSETLLFKFAGQP